MHKNKNKAHDIHESNQDLNLSLLKGFSDPIKLILKWS